MQYLKAEKLKYKRTMMNKLLFIAPFVTIIFCFLAGGVNIFQSAGIYWWYMFVLQGLISVLCFLSLRVEGIAGQNGIIYSLPVGLKKIKIVKNVIMVKKLFIANVMIAVFLAIIPVLLFPNYIKYTFGELLLGVVIIVLTSMWQIPFCFILMSKMNVFIPIIINTLLGIFTIVLVGHTSFWYLWPYCWTAKEMEAILKININGVPEFQGGYVKAIDIVVIFISIILFAVLTYLDAKIFEKRRE